MAAERKLEKFDISTNRLLAALNTKDDVGAVIRMHFELDQALNHVAKAAVPRVDQLRLRYPEQKIRFFLALGVEDKHLEPARLLNQIRNRFAHSEGQEIVTDADVAALEGAIGVIGFSEVCQKVMKVVDRDYEKLTPREKFCILGVVIISHVSEIISLVP